LNTTLIGLGYHLISAPKQRKKQAKKTSEENKRRKQAKKNGGKLYSNQEILFN
jgi:hypothetical protein